MKLIVLGSLSTAIITLAPSCAQTGDGGATEPQTHASTAATPSDQADQTDLAELPTLQPRKHSHSAFVQPHIRHRRTSPR